MVSAMSMRYTLAMASAMAMAMGACSGMPAPVSTTAASGSARIALMSVAQVPAIDHVTLTITGASVPMKEGMTKVDEKETQYAATVDSIPAGTYTFTADAWAEPAETTLVATGAATGVVIIAGGSASVIITMHEVNPAPGPTRKMPQIDTLTASSSPVGVGGVVGVSVSAHSPEGHSLTYVWSDGCDGAQGAFADATVASTTWTAPATSMSCLLSVMISDATDSSSVTAFLPIFVAELPPGPADVTAVLDTFPIVVVGTADTFIVTSEPAPQGLNLGITAKVVALGSDPDGDTVTLLWTSNPECSGTFTHTADDEVTFHTDDPKALCTLTLTTTDSRGNSVAATIMLTENLCAGVTCPAGQVCNPADGQCTP
jgi:hypothetical protein